MKNLMLVTLVLLAVFLSACAQKDNYYDRANNASENALYDLEKE